MAALPPTFPPSSSCKPPPLPEKPNCRGQPGEPVFALSQLFFSGLTGEALSAPRKLVLLLLFSFEADTLEVQQRPLTWPVPLISYLRSSSIKFSQHVKYKVRQNQPYKNSFLWEEKSGCWQSNSNQSWRNFSAANLTILVKSEDIRMNAFNVAQKTPFATAHHTIFQR